VFEELTMDFITGLPPSSDGHCAYDAILVIVDRYSKMARYVPALKTWTALDVAEMFFKEVVCRYGVPKGIVSDRGSVFTSEYWGEICYQTQMIRKLSTAFHPQTDGQTERQNQSLEHYLRVYCCAEQDNWVSLLPMAEFAYNNSRHASTAVSPFYAVHGRNANFPGAPEDGRLEREVPSAIERVERMRSAREQLEEHLRAAQQSQKKYYDQHHTPMAFKPGDMVLLNCKNLKLTRPNKKLSDKFVGPFRVQSAVGTQAYRLYLPPKYRIHDVFHISLLKLHRRREGDPTDTAEPVDVLPDGEEVWEVERILDRKKHRGKTWYYLRWKDCSEEYDEWISEDKFENMDEHIRDYEQSLKTRTRNKRRRTARSTHRQ